MKRIVLLVLAIFIFCSLTACAGTETAPVSGNDEGSSAVSEKEPERSEAALSSDSADPQVSADGDGGLIVIDDTLIIDEYSFDIDGDGVAEDCVMTFGPTSGLFTITIIASSSGEVRYKNTFLMDVGSYTFGRDEHTGEILKDGTLHSRIYASEGRIIIENSDPDAWSYWGGEEWNLSLPQSSFGKTAVVYFSATGTTRHIAEMIASQTGADLLEIVPKEPYTEDDLKYRNPDSRAAREQNSPDVRPGIDGIPSLDGYDNVFLGYPIWFAQAPRIMSTFVESRDFSGITVIPFCTSGSSDIGQSDDSLAAQAGTGTWLEGKRFPGSASESDIEAWIEMENSNAVFRTH